MNIGFFDSGLGGLTILGETVRMLPAYEYLYYGDTAHVPYGDRTEVEIFELTRAGVEYLFLHNCNLVVLACNTASAETLRRLQDTYLVEQYPTRRILGVVIPTIEEMIESGAQEVLLLATKRTIESRKYDIELAKRNITHLKLHSLATPRLVPFIEEGNLDAAAAAAISAISEQRTAIDTVVLGCTHYALLKHMLRMHFGSTLHVMSQDEIIPRKLAQYLMRHPEIESALQRTGKRTIHLTDQRSAYQAVCDRILNTHALTQ